jgi:hypothetical protein
MLMGCAAIEAEGSVEGVKITAIKGMWSISATIEAANWDATAMSRSASWQISCNSATLAGRVGRI